MLLFSELLVVSSVLLVLSFPLLAVSSMLPVIKGSSVHVTVPGYSSWTP